MSGPPVQRLGPAVILQGPALAAAAYLVAAGLRHVSQRDGIEALDSWRLMLRDLELAAAEGRNVPATTSDIPAVQDERALPAEDLISTREAATIMQLTERQTRRLAAELGARRAGHALVFDRGLVVAEADRRQEMSA